ncbi:MAG: sigma-54-dependent Fis family transcriptional regulator [Devosia sp.]|nr:sigma-54-dependent Fis family transcriptional regulator [Devosia sp.]
MLSRSERIKRARITLMHGGQLDRNLIAPQISESWNRCIEFGLDPGGLPPVVQVTAKELREQRQRDELVHRFAVAQMQALYQQIAGSNFMIAFGNTQGTVLETVSDGQFRDSKPGKSIVPGSVWIESLRGTNAMGTSAAIGQPLIVHGEEHFFLSHADVSCFAAPIFHSNGELAGVLDASSDCRARHAHTLVLMQMAATHIENSLFLKQQERHCMLLFHSRGELLNSVSGGLISFDASGRLTAVNQRGREILSGLPVRPGAAFEAIFDTSFGAAFTQLADHPHPTLRDLLGSQYAVQWANPHKIDARHLPLALKPGLTARPRIGMAGFVADDPALQTELIKVERAVRLKPPFLILGESGTGKEIMARHIHVASGRRGAFVPFNCGAMPEHLFEAELFGYVQGAFTGARKEGAAGLANAADGGTLFLDEIGDLPMSSQVALLRFLDLSEVRAIGATQAQKLDVQVVAATNIDLEQAIADKRFRADLFYRLSVVQLTLPPLRKRRDFHALAQHLLAAITAEIRITEEALALLSQHHWAGNLRELRSVLFQLSLLVTDGGIEGYHVQQVLGGTDPDAAGRPQIGLRGLITRQINELLRSNGNNISETAKALSISRNTVYKYMRSRRLN